MTTAQETATPAQTAREMLQELSQARSKLPDPADLVLTENQRQAYTTVLARFNAYSQDIGKTLALFDGATARLAEWTPVRERMRAVEATLLGRLRAEPKSEELKASLVTLRRGGITRDGERLIGMPRVLAGLLTDRCAHCGNAKVMWAGPLLQLDEDVAEASAQVAQANVRLTNYLIPDVEALLALVSVPVTVSS